MEVLVLGDGLLGLEIIKQSNWNFISTQKEEIDVTTNFESLMYRIDDFEPDVVVNCIGYTNTYDTERQTHWKVNYEFVVNLCDFCDSRDIKLVHMSTDYIYANSQGGCAETDIPVHQETWYSYCKLLADGYVQLNDWDHLIIRGSLKPTPFPYEKAFTNITGTFEYVDVIAKQIIELVQEDRSGVWNVGSESKSMYDLAKQTKPDVGKSFSPKLPSIELDLTKFQTKDSK